MDPAVRAVVERVIGPIRRWTDHTRGDTTVLRADVVWVKRHPSARKYAQERAAYRLLVPALADAGFRVPSLVHADDDARVLVLDHVAGEPARIGLADEVARFVGTLRALPCPADPLPLSAAIPRRLAGWIARADGHVPDAVLARAQAEIADGGAFVGVERTWCHRDLGRHNWLDDDGRLGIVDFEHAGPDVWLVDLLKLDDADRAVVNGDLSAEDLVRLRQLEWLHAIATVAWARAHGDRRFEADGLRLLGRLSR